MFRCDMCNKLFDEPRKRQTTYESYYGTEGYSWTPLTILICPYCGDDEIEEVEEFEEEEEEEEEEEDEE